MHRISPAPPERYEEVAEHMARWKKTKGYPPNSWLTMLRKPRVFRAYRELHTAVMVDPGEVPKGLKYMIAEVVSMATGDPYCAVHNAENAVEQGGVEIAKIEALGDFRTSTLFTDAHFDALQKHWSEDAIVEIVSVLALLGWLNRWCMTFAPELEPQAAAFAEKHLARSGWAPRVRAPKP